MTTFKNCKWSNFWSIFVQ